MLKNELQEDSDVTDCTYVLVERKDIREKIREATKHVDIFLAPWFNEFLDKIAAAYEGKDPYTAAAKGTGKRAAVLLEKGYDVPKDQCEGILDLLQHRSVLELAEHKTEGRRHIFAYRVLQRPTSSSPDANEKGHI